MKGNPPNDTLPLNPWLLVWGITPEFLVSLGETHA